MRTDDYPDPGELAELHAEDLHVADLLATYVQAREAGTDPQLPQLLQAAAAFSPGARRKLRTVIGLYQAATHHGR